MKKQSLTLSKLAVIGLMAVSANATTIMYNTDAPGTLFTGGDLDLTNSSGAAAMLRFTPNGDISSGVPSGLNFGFFTLSCASCGTEDVGDGSFFSAFTFDLALTDVTDGATGTFVGTSTGGAVFSDSSQVTITWVPMQLGPGTTNADSGNFETSAFGLSNDFTQIVAPNSGGANSGQTTIQGSITSVVPEPSTNVLMGAGLLCLGLLSRRIRPASSRPRL